MRFRILIMFDLLKNEEHDKCCIICKSVSEAEQIETWDKN